MSAGPVGARKGGPARAGRGRGLHLHLRERRGDLVALGVLVVGAGAAPLAWWLTAQARLAQAGFGPQDVPASRLPVVVLAPVLAAVLVSITLHGADLDLDATASRLSRRWRAAHATLVAVATTVVLGASMAPWGWDTGSAATARTCAGLVGLVLLGVTVLPPLLSWVPAFVYGSLVSLLSPDGIPGASWWLWAAQPGPPDASWVVAGVLLVAGVVAYALRGPAHGSSRP